MPQPQNVLTPPPVRPAPVRRPVSPARLEEYSTLGQLTVLINEMQSRFPQLPLCVIREQMLDVLCLASRAQLQPAMLVRLIEARMHAML